MIHIGKPFTHRPKWIWINSVLPDAKIKKYRVCAICRRVK